MRRVVLASFAGSTIECDDFFLYETGAVPARPVRRFSGTSAIAWAASDP